MFCVIVMIKTVEKDMFLFFLACQNHKSITMVLVIEQNAVKGGVDGLKLWERTEIDGRTHRCYQVYVHYLPSSRLI